MPRRYNPKKAKFAKIAIVSLSERILANSLLKDSGTKAKGLTEFITEPDTVARKRYFASPISFRLCSNKKEWSTLPFGISSKIRGKISPFNSNNYTNSLYLRFEVKDKPGVLSRITNRLAKYKISVKRLIQTPDKKNNKATIVIVTHKTNELNSKNCLSIFKKDKNILNYPTLIRMYN